uniref:Putative capsid protein n=1 Tax=viral metagenome TaxID=1070528 RepID=A0A6M3XKA9_9ZZZZ
MAIGTTTTTAAALKNYWHDFFLENLYADLAMKGLTKTTKVSKNQGKVCWWVGVSKINPIGAALSEGQDPTARSSAASRISGTLAEYGNLIKNSRLFMDVSIDGTKEQIMKDLAKDAAKTLDDTVLAKAIAGSNVIYSAGKLHRSDMVKAATATIKDIRKAVRLLQLSSVPRFPDGYYVGLAHPDIAYDLQSDSAWQDIVKYRDSVKYDIPNELGRIWGVRFALAPTIPILTNSGSANADLYRTMVFGPDYMGQSELGELEVVMNEPGRGTELKQYNTYGYRFVLSTERLDESRAVRIESTASLGTN